MCNPCYGHELQAGQKECSYRTNPRYKDPLPAIVEQYGGPDPMEDPEWWADGSNFDGDLVDLF